MRLLSYLANFGGYDLGPKNRQQKSTTGKMSAKKKARLKMVNKSKRRNRG